MSHHLATTLVAPERLRAAALPLRGDPSRRYRPAMGRGSRAEPSSLGHRAATPCKV